MALSTYIFPFSPENVVWRRPIHSEEQSRGLPQDTNFYALLYPGAPDTSHDHNASTLEARRNTATLPNDATGARLGSTRSIIRLG